ncbi:MAG: MiaB/RimO family radical SAM methylthiotransferase [Rickettsiales bacterium]|jgi:threonylcarbamoyladenosine tRNA methylthiotransferase MtaB|nr:MiaB/RimO family radical SAM methylthiotransferase [Rickettsiales bacterium]
MKNQGKIQICALGCRLNALEAEKIRAMLDATGMGRAVVINTCSVTNEAQRQSRQAFHKILRENPGVPIFVTGCGATLKPGDFAGATVVSNEDKFNPAAYGLRIANREPRVAKYEKMQKKGFVQIGDGCDRRCTYCVTRILRGGAKSFPYDRIMADARALLDNGYEEIVLTGVNIADYNGKGTGKKGLDLAGLCRKLLTDLPEMKRLSLSSLDPAADIESIIGLIAGEPRMTPHLHLSVQSGSNEILRRMARRHTRERIREIMSRAPIISCPSSLVPDITFSWDIICGFPGETEEMFDETLALARELRPVKIHAFPFSARPGTPAADMPGKIPRAEAKERVRRLILPTSGQGNKIG